MSPRLLGIYCAPYLLSAHTVGDENKILIICKHKGSKHHSISSWSTIFSSNVLVITNIKTARVRNVFSPYCPPPFHSSLAIYVSTSLPLFIRKERRPNTEKKWLIGESFLPRFGHYKPLLSSLQSRFQAEALQPQLSLDHLSIQVVAASTHAKQFITAACIPRLTPLPAPWKSCIPSFKLWHLVKQYVETANQSHGPRDSGWTGMRW